MTRERQVGVPGYSCYQGSETLRTGLAEGRCSHSSWSDTDQTLFGVLDYSAASSEIMRISSFPLFDFD